MGARRVRSGARRGLTVLVALVVLAGCQGGETSGETGRSAGASASRSSTSTPPQPAEITVVPADGATGVMPDDEVSVAAVTGRIERVEVSTKGGPPVEGALTGGEWSSTSRLAPSARYSVAVTSVGPDGTRVTSTSGFSTHEPAVTATYGMVYAGQTVGVAMPVSLQFDSEVTTRAFREQIERAVTVTTSPKTEGSWGWLDNRQLMWRPKAFWQPGTTVRLDAPLTGFQTGEDKWVADDVSGSMTIGREQMTKVDIAGHQMTVTRGGQALRTIPVSSGKPGPETETRSGLKVVINKVADMTMDSATVGIDKGEPGYYNVDTSWNVRVTWTGEFLHSAPWSLGSQGRANVSHGCVNMAPEHARWVYENSIPGDPVDFTGSGREFLPTEGIGVWQYSYAGWQQQSALV